MRCQQWKMAHFKVGRKKVNKIKLNRLFIFMPTSCCHVVFSVSLILSIYDFTRWELSTAIENTQLMNVHSCSWTIHYCIVVLQTLCLSGSFLNLLTRKKCLTVLWLLCSISSKKCIGAFVSLNHFVTFRVSGMLLTLTQEHHNNDRSSIEINHFKEF